MVTMTAETYVFDKGDKVFSVVLKGLAKLSAITVNNRSISPALIQHGGS